MKFKFLGISLLCLLFALLLTTVALADENGGDQTEDEVQVVETDAAVNAASEEVMEEEAAVEEVSVEEEMGEEEPVVAYLEDLPGTDGSFSPVFKLSEEGEDSPFFGRYHDPFAGDSFFFNQIFLREVMGDSSRMTSNIEDTWDPSWRGSFEYWDPGQFRLWASGNNLDFYEIPDAFMANREAYDFGLEITGRSSDTYTASYHHRGKDVTLPGAESPIMAWESDDLDFGVSFDLSNWDVSFDMNTRNYDAGENSIDNVDTTTSVLRIGNNFGDNSYIEGSYIYSNSEVWNGEDLESSKFGLYGRFMNALGMDRFNVTSHISWTERSDGPSQFHPAGNQFNFDLKGDWRVSPELRMWGSFDRDRGKVTYPDQWTHYAYISNPFPVLPYPSERYFTETIITDKWNFGGRWDITPDLDFTADLTWTDRENLPSTDFVYVGSGPLRWNDEARHVYTVRYQPGDGTWLVRYETDSRVNDARSSSSDVEHWSVSWTGMVNENLWVYAGGGSLETSITVPGFTDLKQDGTEYGGGWTWYWSNGWSFYGDFWRYEVGGAFGYDQTSLMLGVGQEYPSGWGWTVEYKSVDGEFIDLDNLDYDVEDLLLNLSYKW